MINDRQRIAGSTAILWLLALVGMALTPAAQAGSDPSVAIVSPTDGATVKGTIAVQVTATAAPGETIYSISLHDGANDIGSESCEAQPRCTVTIRWPATGLSGRHALQAQADSNNGLTGTSEEVAVTVESPPPTIVITSPTAGTTVAGTVSVSASAATDPSQDEYPTSILFYDGVNYLDSISCQGQRTCEGSIKWHASGLSGAHALTARVGTSRDLSVTSAATMVNVVSPPPTVAITSPGSGASLGREITVRAAGHTDPSQEEYPTSIAVYDGVNSIGSFNCQGQQTCEGSIQWDARGLRGLHVLVAVISTSRGHSARSAPVSVGLSARRRVSASCQLATHSAKVEQKVHGSCSVRGAPAGTPAEVQFLRGSRWHTAVRGQVLAGGRFNFTLRGARRARFNLWVYVSATSRTVATRAHLGVLLIV